MIKYSLPFPHIASDQALPNDKISRLENISNHEIKKWEREEGKNYRFSRLEQNLNLQSDNSVEAGALTKWKADAESFFQIRLAPAVSSTIFRFCSGDCIGLHDDSDAEAVRLIVAVSGERSLGDGGSILLMADSLENSKLILPSRNLGVCFHARAGHGHAVTTIRHSPLFLFIVEFPCVS